MSTTPVCTVEIEDATGRWAADTLAWVAKRGKAAGEHLDCSGEVRVRLVGDAAMSAAHLKHLGDASTTDVMTFDMADGSAATTRVLDADVLICLDEAERQASLRRHGAPLEVLLYLVHAILHCLGYDDQTRAGARSMHETEDRVLSAIGVGVVYRAGLDGATVVDDEQRGGGRDGRGTGEAP